MALLLFTDLVTLRCGRRRRDNSCDALRTHAPRRRADGRESKIPSVESLTGLGRCAITGALNDLRDAGYITSHQPRSDYRDDAGETRWRSYPTVHAITKTGLVRLGVDLGWLEDERQKAHARELAGPEPIVDIRQRRERQRLIRAQALAAKRTHMRPPAARPPRRRRE